MAKIKNANIDVHTHPFLSSNKVIDVVETMRKNNLHVTAVEALDNSIFPQVLDEARKTFPGTVYDSAGLKLPDSRYIMNAREYNTKENLHILTVGYTLDTATPKTGIKKIIEESLDNGALVILDHPYADNTKTKTAGHIGPELEQKVEDLLKEYSGHVAVEWNGYCLPEIRRPLMVALNYMGFPTRYWDVNKKAEELSLKLKKKGYNVPLLADTDLHARDRHTLKAMGASRFIIDLEGGMPCEILKSMKENIFKNKYTNVKHYVSVPHILRAFCFPILLPYIFPKPRA